MVNAKFLKGQRFGVEDEDEGKPVKRLTHGGWGKERKVWVLTGGVEGWVQVTARAD